MSEVVLYPHAFFFFPSPLIVYIHNVANRLVSPLFFFCFFPCLLLVLAVVFRFVNFHHTFNPSGLCVCYLLVDLLGF